MKQFCSSQLFYAANRKHPIDGVKGVAKVIDIKYLKEFSSKKTERN